MIMMQMELEPGFRKADLNNIPTVRSETIFGFVTRIATSGNSVKNQSTGTGGYVY